MHLFDTGHAIRREKCTGCSACSSVCPTGAIELLPRALSKEGFLELVEKQRRVMGSEGGITFSGGEPLMQAEAILSLLEDTDIHTAIETSGYADESVFCRVIEKMDFVMLDIKISDDVLHKRYTGVSNKLILKNLEHLRKSGKPYLLRTPMIPGITDTPKNLSEIKNIVGSDPWEALPYNPLTPSKYESIGLDFSLI